MAVFTEKMFDLSGKRIVVTGGSGVLGRNIAMALLQAGGQVAVTYYQDEKARRFFAESDVPADNWCFLQTDVTNPQRVEQTLASVVEKFGKVDALINCAGGNTPAATSTPEQKFFDMPISAFNTVVELNLAGTVVPSQIFARHFAEKGSGVILNISSMAAMRPLTRVAAYSAAKAAVSNFTQWLAVHLAQEYSPNIRVNAIAPGFFITTQNRFLLTDEKTGELTPRGESIIAQTPAGRFGQPDELNSTVIWLLSDASAFVNGAVIPVDGGFSAFGGV